MNFSTLISRIPTSLVVCRGLLFLDKTILKTSRRKKKWTANAFGAAATEEMFESVLPKRRISFQTPSSGSSRIDRNESEDV
jgi:hypothetical protein